MRRGSVAMEEAEAKRTGDVYREIKVGAAFEGLPGRERSELAPGVFLHEPGPTQYVARCLSARSVRSLSLRAGPTLWTGPSRGSGGLRRWSALDSTRS
jgi:hypothetical protein